MVEQWITFAQLASLLKLAKHCAWRLHLVAACAMQNDAARRQLAQHDAILVQVLQAAGNVVQHRRLCVCL